MWPPWIFPAGAGSKFETLQKLQSLQPTSGEGQRWVIHGKRSWEIHRRGKLCGTRELFEKISVWEGGFNGACQAVTQAGPAVIW